MTPNSDILYGFVMKGMLTDISLDSTQRLKKKSYSDQEFQHFIDCLAINEFDEELVKQSQKMAIVYTAITTFENATRKFVSNLLKESYADKWWDEHVSKDIKTKAETRKAEEAKVKWHTARGEEIISYIEFGHLFIIIKNNWPIFEPFLNSQEWTEYILKTIERSRNVIMHSGDLANQDIERVGSAIRDWIKQVGT